MRTGQPRISTYIFRSIPDAYPPECFSRYSRSRTTRNGISVRRDTHLVGTAIGWGRRTRLITVPRRRHGASTLQRLGGATGRKIHPSLARGGHGSPPHGSGEPARR